MWQTYQKATKYGKLPSEILKIEDALAAWMFDGAVTWFGITIENALALRDKVGSEYKPRYTLSRLLSQDFRLIPPTRLPEENANPFAVMASWLGRSKQIKRWVYVPPVDDEVRDA